MIDLKSIFRKQGFYIEDERIERISEKIQSEGFMWLILILNILLIIRTSFYNQPFSKFWDFGIVLAAVSFYVGIKSAMNGATRGSKAIYNICLCFICPLIMTMNAIEEVVRNTNAVWAVVLLITIPLVILFGTMFVINYSEQRWNKNNETEEENEEI